MVHTEDRDGEPSTIVPRVATFFTLYPETLGFADGKYFCIALDSAPVRGFSDRVALHLNVNHSPVWLNAELSASLVVSARFHRGSRDQEVFADLHDKLMPIVEKASGNSFPPLDRLDEDERTVEGADRQTDAIVEENPSVSSYTVVEMTTQVVFPRLETWDACLVSDEVMGPTLTRCIDGLMKIVDAYRFSEKVLLPTPARERLGPLVVAATRPANPKDGNWDKPARLVLNNFAAYGRHPFPRGGHDVGTEARMSLWLAYERLGHPVVPLAHLQDDVDNAFYNEGNFRSTVVFAHSASEVLLDIALMGMLYEENLSPEDALRVFEKPLKTRVLTQYHDRLGGQWVATGNGVVAEWLAVVLQVRHRVAHSGYSPVHEEAEAARETYRKLGTYLRDRLASRVRRYPFTAGLLLAQGGLARRNIHTKAARNAVAIAESSMITQFVKWRSELNDLRS